MMLLPPKARRARRRLPPSAVDISIVASRVIGVAPLGVFLHAAPSGAWLAEVDGLDIDFTWDFGDLGDYANLPGDFVHGASRNVAAGHMTAHTYAAPGTYTATCTATDGTNTVTKAVQITVQALGDVFSASDIHVVSEAGDFTGAPSGSTQHTTLAAARTAMGGTSAVLLRRGETFTGSYDLGFESRIYRNVLIGAFGPEADGRPVVSSTIEMSRDFSFPEPGPTMTVSGVRIEFPYDAATGIGSRSNGVRVEEEEGHLTVHDCYMTGVESGLRLNSDTGYGVCSDTIVTNWHDFGVLGGYGDGHFAVTGCDIRQKPDAISLGGKTSDVPEYANHGPIRLSNIKYFVCRRSRLFSNTGWSGQFGGPAGSAHQQCVRWNSDGIEGVEAVFDRNVMEGGFEIIALTDNTSGDNPTVFVTCLFEGNYLLATANTSTFVSLSHTGIDFRNNVCVIPAVDGSYDQPLENWEGQRTTGEVDGAYAKTLRFRNNTLVDLRDSAQTNPISLNFDPLFTNVTVEHNLIHYPNYDTPQVDYAPVETSPALFAALYQGRYDGGTPDLSFATPAGTAASYKPLAGSAALTPVSPSMLLAKDFAGNLRGATVSVGAHVDETA